MEVEGSEAQGRHREVGSEGSVEQRHGPMNKYRMMRSTVPGELASDAKPISIKGTGGKSGGRVSKAVELISGDLLCVTES
jgi:hypothetical protein